MEPVTTSIAIKVAAPYVARYATRVGVHVTNRWLDHRLKPQKSTALSLAQQRYLAAQADREERGLELQKLHLAMEHQHHQQDIALALQKIQADFDLKHWPGEWSREEMVKLLNNAESKQRLLVLLSEPTISASCPPMFRQDFPLECRAEIKHFIEQHYPLHSELYPVEFLGKFFESQAFNTQAKQLESLLAGVPSVILYGDLTDEKLYLHLYAWGWQETLSETIIWNWEETKDQLLADGMAEKQALREIRRTITQFYQLFAALLADMYYLSVNPLHEPQLLQINAGTDAAAIAPYRARLLEVREQVRVEYEAYVRDNLPPDIHGWSTSQVQNLQKRAAEKMGLPVVFQDRMQSGGLGPKMAVIPAGSFLMGSPPDELIRSYHQRVIHEGQIPQHRVTFAQPFALGIYAVTFDEYDRFCENTGHGKPSDAGRGRGQRPVVFVNWHDVQAYCAWLSRQTGQTYRLPSEAEWEYACRAGTVTPFWWGNTITTRQANYDGNYTYNGEAKGEYREKTLPVGDFAPNPWGLYQVHGNVWEWLQDRRHFNYQNAPCDGSAWVSGDDDWRISRGGGYRSSPDYLCSARRMSSTPDTTYIDDGFRLARNL